MTAAAIAADTGIDVHARHCGAAVAADGSRS